MSLAAGIAAGKVKGSVEAIERDGEEIIAKHAANLPVELRRMQELLPGAVVEGRAKKLPSAMEKVVRKPHNYQTVSDLKDLTGMRGVAPTVDGVYKAVAAIKSRYKVVEDDDAIAQPKEGHYRSYHLTIIGDDKMPKEIQVRTPGQHVYAEWSHNVYKPLTREQEHLSRTRGPDLDAFSKRVSDYYYASETGKSAGEKPKCPPYIGKAFGCP